MRNDGSLDMARYHDGKIQRGLIDKTVSIDVAMRIADEDHCWSKAFIDTALEKAKKDKLRKVFQKGYHDADGNFVRNFNIEDTDPKTGETVQGYKQPEFFDADNWEWTVRDARTRYKIEERRFEKICRMAIKACGKKFQKRFDFQLPTGKGAGV